MALHPQAPALPTDGHGPGKRGSPALTPTFWKHHPQFPGRRSGEGPAPARCWQASSPLPFPLVPLGRAAEPEGGGEGPTRKHRPLYPHSLSRSMLIPNVQLNDRGPHVSAGS